MRNVVLAAENVWGAWNGITPRDGEALRCGNNVFF
jgi:hypothetical protein